MMWPRVIGQRRVKESLLAARRRRKMPHAYLLYGGEGVGKDALAIELARVLRCEREEDEACGICPSCEGMATLQHPDVRLITPLPRWAGEESGDDPLAKLPDADIRAIQRQIRLKAENPYHRIVIPRGNVIKINSIRQIRREASLSTSRSGVRIFIIPEADAMDPPAANTLLKTLEEPPSGTLLILTTAHPEALLPTILSRCQKVRLDPLTAEEIAAALTERDGVAPEQASLVSRLANGSYTRALELMQLDVMQMRKDVVDFVRKALGKDIVDLTAAIEAVVDTKDRDVAVRFLTLMLVWFRDALVMSHGSQVINLDQETELKNFLARFPGADLLRVMADVEKAISLVERYVYIKLVLLQLALELKAAILPGAATRLPAIIA